MGQLLPLMSDGMLRFSEVEADVRRAYRAIGDATVRSSSIVFASAAQSSVARLGQIVALGLPGQADVRDQNLRVHVLEWVQDHTLQRAVCVGGDGAAPSALEGLASGFALRMSRARPR